MAYLPTKEPPISLNTTISNARSWLNIIRYREYGTVIQLQDDSPYRVADIIEDPQILKKFLGPYYRKYLLKYVALDQGDLIPTIKTALLELIRDRKELKGKATPDQSVNQLLTIIGNEGFEVGLFIGGVGRLLTQSDFAPLFELEHILEKSRNLSVILFSETDITADKFSQLPIKCSLLFDHVSKYPLYEEADSRQFIRYNNSMWQMKMTVDTESEMIRLSGGYLWLISALQRYLRDNPESNLDAITTDFVLLQKLESIWSKFTNVEKNILRNVQNDTLLKEEIESHGYRHLLDMRIILLSGKKSVLGIPLLSQVIKRERKLDGIKVVDNKIYAKEIDITSNFSEYENKFLTLILARKREIVSRDEVAKILWGNAWEDKYSDWAIDRLAYRLRKKMKDIGADPELFKTAKRKGFMFA